MNKMRWLLVLMVCCSLPLPARADIVGDVFKDITHFITDYFKEEFLKLDEQLHELTNVEGKLDDLKEAYKEEIQKIIEEQTGHYHLGDLLDGDSDVDDWLWAPDAWDDAIEGLASESPSHYQQLLRDYDVQHPFDEQALARGAAEGVVEGLAQWHGVNRAAMSQATYSYDGLQAHIQRIHELAKKIEQTDNMKAALDLNSRLLVELNYLSVESIHQGVLQNQQAAQHDAMAIEGAVLQSAFLAIDNAKESL